MANDLQLAGGDIFPALEKGTIDAAEWVGPYDDERLLKIAPHCYYPGWWEGGSMIFAFVNLDKWNALPKSYQAALTAAGHYANTWSMAKYDAANPQAIRNGSSPAARSSSRSRRRLWTPVTRQPSSCTIEVAATNADFKKVLDAMLAFRNDQYLWWQIAEYSYDSYLIRARARG